MVGSPWVEVVLRLFNQIPMYQSYTLRQANLAPENLWLKEKDRQGTSYILSGTQNCDGQFPISRWFSYIDDFPIYPIVKPPCIGHFPLPHLIYWMVMKWPTVLSVGFEVGPAWLPLPVYWCMLCPDYSVLQVGDWLEGISFHLILLNYIIIRIKHTVLQHLQHLWVCLFTHTCQKNIYIFIYIWSLLLLIQPPCLSEPKNFGEATPCSPLRFWPWLRPRTLAPPWPVRCGTLGLPWRTPNFMAKSVLSEGENG
jgi:hypothetical protein